MVGYDGNYVTPLDLHHRCPYCNCALRDPLQTECGHRICKECYGELQRKSGKTGEIICPVDGSIVLPEQVYPDMYAKREVLNIPTFCIFREDGCQWKGTLRDFEPHITTCEFQVLLCEAGCGQRLPKHLMEQHRIQTCPQRPTTCNFCKQEVIFSKLQEHYDACEFYPIDCRYNCGELKIPRKFLQEHFENYCKNVEGACVFSFCGCTFRGTKEDIDDHLQKDTYGHLKLSANHASSLEAKNSELQKKLDNEVTKACKLEEKVVQQDDELSAIKEQYSMFQSHLNSLEKEFDKTRKSDQEMQQNVGILEKRSGPSMIKDIDSLKDQARQVEQKVEQIKQRVNENSHVRQSQTYGASSLNVVGGEIEKRTEKLENQLAMQDVQIAELKLKLQLLESTSYDGSLVWKIDNFQRRKQDAIMGKSPSLYSPPFYTSRFGYKMCARIYLNGDGQGKTSHISLFFVVMRSEYDSLLDWPFPCKITMKLLAQEGSSHIVEAFRPDPNSSSFRRPSSEMNIASGVPLFASQQKVASGPYIKKDSIYIQIIVDTATLPSRF